MSLRSIVCVPHRKDQWRKALKLLLCIGSKATEQVNNRIVSLRGGTHQNRPPAFINRIRIGFILAEKQGNSTCLEGGKCDETSKQGAWIKSFIILWRFSL